ncbi:MAG: alcohol dehydrogenase catalytic domain-containing protein [Candidatus Bathyarchaeia archaeon]
MKAALLYGPRDLRVEEIDIPRISDDQVLIKIMACGICPTDVRVYTGDRHIIVPGPRVMGHEWVGEIVEVGKNIKNFKVGDRVAVNGKIPCGRCYYCINGLDRMCPDLFNIGRASVTPGMAEFGKASERAIFPIPENVSYIEASFAEPLSCCINAVQNCNVKFGDDVLIIGAGPMGLILMQLCKIQGARIIVSETIEERLKKAKELGSDDIINPKEVDFVKTIKDLTGGRGPDVVIVSIGNPMAEMQALEVVRKNGVVCFFGGTWPEVKLEINPNFIHYNEIKLTGASNYNYSVFPRSLKLMASKLIKLETLVSHILPLERAKEGFELVEKRIGLKVIVSPSEKYK